MEQTISVIIPAYNIENFLGPTLDSVLAQTHKDIEVIVVNDGSTDGTGAILDAYAARDSRIKAIHKENGGVTSARLRGVAEATGEWIGFVDGDDYIEPDMYEHLLKNALEHSADISHCGYQMVFPQGRVDYYYNTGRKTVQPGLRGCSDLLAGDFVEPGLWNKLYRRELFNDLSTHMNADIRINEDVLMNYYLFKNAKLAVYEDFCPYHYVLRAGSAATSRLNHHKLWDPLIVLHIIQEDAPAELQPVVLQRLTRLLISGACMTDATQPELIRPYRAQCRKELRRGFSGFFRVASGRLKLMTLWTAVWPWSYGFVHRRYLRITGLDRIYDLE